MLCCTDDDGVLKDLADVAFEIRSSEEKAQQLIDALIAAGMFDRDADGVVTARDWQEHNPPSDSADATAAERNRKYRERRKTERNARNGDGVTPVTATALDTDTERTEGETDARDVTPPPVTDEFKKFWDAYPKRQGDPESAAEMAWDLLKNSGDLPKIDVLLSAVTRWKAARKLESDPPFAPYAKTWLAEKRWNDWPEPPPPEPHKRDWAEAYPDTWAKLKASTTPNEWAFWLGKCTVNGPPHVLYAPDKMTREKVEQKYGARISAMFGDKGTVRVLGEIQHGAAA